MRSTFRTIVVALALMSAASAFADGGYDIGEKQTYGVGDVIYGGGPFGDSIVVLARYPKRKEFTISHREIVGGRSYAETVTLDEGDAIAITHTAGKKKKCMKVLVRLMTYGPWCVGEFLVRSSM